MTTKSRIEALRERHLSLLERSQQKEIGEVTLQEIKTFVTEVHNSGSNVFDPQERDLLRSFILYWGTVIYERTGSYPDMTLAPFSGEVPRKGLLSDWRAWALVVVIGVLILSLGAGAGQLIRSYLSVRQPLTVRILQPRNGDSVPYEMQIRGDYIGSVEAQNLWVIVYPHGSLYYPQRPAEIRGDNTWFVTAHFGEAAQEESVKAFDISVYLANSQADQKLREYINEADKTGNWPGMPSLVDGLTLLDRVTVTRPGR